MTSPQILASLAALRLPAPPVSVLGMPAPNPLAGMSAPTMPNVQPAPSSSGIPYLLQPNAGPNNSSLGPTPSAPLPVPAGAGPSLLPSASSLNAFQRLPVPDLSEPAPKTPPPSLGAPSSPNVQPAPTQIGIDQNRLNFLRNSGSGISQIGTTVNPTTGVQTPGHLGFWGGLGKVGATIGDDILRIAAPNVEKMIPGTLGHNQYLQGLQQQYLGNDLATAKSQGELAQQQAQLPLTAAQTAYFAARPDIEQSKIDQKQTAVQERVGQAAAARGQNVAWDANGIPTFTDNMDSQEFKDHQALSAMHQATADKSAVMSDIAKNHYIPGTPEFAEAQRKLSQVDQRLQVAMAGLGLRQQGLQLRKENQAALNTGIDPETGKPFAGAAEITGDDGTPTTIGARFAGHAITQQGKVAGFNDLSGSVSHARNAIQQYIAEGGSLADPTLVAAMSDPNSTIGKVINGKLVQGGLSPTAITAINSVRQLHEQAGILRSSTNGTSSEAQAQRILNTVPVAGDANPMALSKLDEIDNVINRLTPGVAHVAGGLSVHHNGQAAPQSFKTTATGPNGHKIGSNDGGNTWFDVATGKAVQ